MAVALVSGRIAEGNVNYPDNSTVELTFGFTPSAGNFLLLVCSHQGTVTGTEMTLSVPSGWSTGPYYNALAGALEAWVFYKQNCSASDTSVVITTNDVSAAQQGVWSVYEFSGAKTSDATDAAGQSEDVSAVESTSTSIGCGTTSTLTNANGLGVAIAVVDNSDNFAGGSWSSGWSEINEILRTTSTGHKVATKAFSSTTALTASFGTLSTGDQNYGAIVALYEASSGVSGLLSVTLGAATSSATGKIAIAGAASQTLAAATLAGTGAVALAGTASPTLAAATLLAEGDLAISGALAKTLAAASLAATGELALDTGTGTLAKTLDAATLAATGTVTLAGTASPTLAAATLLAEGDLAISGALAKTLAAASLAATGASLGPVSGSVSATLAAATLAAFGARAPFAASRALTVPAESRRLAVEPEDRALAIPHDNRTWSIEP